MVPKQGSVGAAGLPALLYRLACSASSSTLALRGDGDASHTLYIRRGFLLAARISAPLTPLGEILRARGLVSEETVRRSLVSRSQSPGLQGHHLCALGAISPEALSEALRAQAGERLAFLCAASNPYEYAITAGAEPPAALGGHPVALIALLRSEIERRLDPVGRAQLAAELAGRRLELRAGLAPPRSFLGPGERRLLSRLGETATLEALLAGQPKEERGRLLCLLGFLRAVGALAVRTPEATAAQPPPTSPASENRPRPGPVSTPRASAARLLGVHEAASAVVTRRAYLRLARELHPDHHPTVSEPTRAALSARFSQVATAYRTLTSSR